MVNIGADLTLYPRNSMVSFINSRNNPENLWKWSPGYRRNENNEGGGTLIISPYLSVNF